MIFGQNGCSTDTTVTIIERLDPPIFSYVASSFACNIPFGQIQVTPSESNYSYNWEGPLSYTSTQEDISNITYGVYNLTVTNSLGCDSTIQITPPIDSIRPTFLLEGADLTCDTPEVELSIIDFSALDNFIWTGPTGFIGVTPNIIVENPGWYFATVIGSNGCQRADSIFVDQDADAPIIVLANDTITCTDSLLNLSANILSTVTDFSWTGPGVFTSNDLNPEISEPGFYTLTAIGANGCSTSSSLEVSIDTITPKLDIGNDALSCLQSSITVRLGSVGAESYEWQQDGFFISNADSIVINAAGTYSVEATGSNGCVTRDTSVIFSDIEFPVLSNFDVNVDCYNPVAALGDSLANVNWTFEWVGPGIGILNDPIIGVSEAGTYFLNVTGENGCESNFPFNVTVDTLSEPIAQNDFTLNCTFEEQFLSFLIPGQAVDSVLWEFPSGTMIDDLQTTSSEEGNTF